MAALRDVGIEASQASVSRDIAALGLIKVGGRWAPPSVDGASRDPLEQRIAVYTLSVALAGDNLVVVRTPAGEAQGVALALDRLELGGVVGHGGRRRHHLRGDMRMQRRHAGFGSGSRLSCRR